MSTQHDCRPCCLRAIDALKHSEPTRIGLLNARSVGNKCAAICDLVASNCLHLCAVVETWHDSADDPSLIACAPPGYRFIERARPRADNAVENTKTNHGGICLFYSSSVGARQVQLPVYVSKLEVLAVFVHGARRNVLVVVLYWPSTATISNAFFDDLDDVLERSMAFACPVVILGDINVHLDVDNDPHTARFQSMLDSYGLIQNVKTPTHGAHLLDVVITQSDYPAAIRVEPPALSDHSLIVATMNLQFNHGQPKTVVRRRQWRRFDFDSFCEDLRASTLLYDPPSDAVGLFNCYDRTMTTLVDKHAPFADVKIRSHHNAPWYDDDCRTVKALTRRLERIYRDKKLESDRVI